MYDPPIENKKDDRVLGKGSSKVVWKINQDDNLVVVNAYDSQRFRTHTNIETSNKPIQMEYNFTLYLNSIFPKLIPKVFLFENDPFLDNKFRYAKELCEKVVVNDELFNKMIEISDMLLKQGWVYLDMKPANLGLLNGNICILDTDYRSFYRVPKTMIHYFKWWSYLIILMHTYNYNSEVNLSILKKFIQEKGIDKQTLSDLKNNDWNKTNTDIVQFGNNYFKHDRVDKYIRLTDILTPYNFFETYGKKGQQDYNTRFTELVDTIPIKKYEPSGGNRVVNETNASLSYK